MIATLHVLAFTEITIGAVVFLSWPLFFGSMYYHLSRKHAAYYKSINSPTLWYPFVVINVNAHRNAAGQRLMWSWTLRGLPKNFPRDDYCKRRVSITPKYVRFLKASAYIWSLAFISLVILFIKYNAWGP